MVIVFLLKIMKRSSITTSFTEKGLDESNKEICNGNKTVTIDNHQQKLF